MSPEHGHDADHLLTHGLGLHAAVLDGTRRIRRSSLPARGRASRSPTPLSTLDVLPEVAGR